MRRTSRGWLGAAAVVVLCGSCSAMPAHLPSAAEPSVAALLAAPPAGRLVQLPIGSAPEGVAVDQRTGTVVVALRNPDRIALVDTRTLSARIRPSPGEARHLILMRPGGPVLLPAENAGEIFELALPSGRVIRGTKVLRQPHNAAVVGADVWVADELAPAISVLDSQGSVVATLHGPAQPGGVVTAAGTVGVTDVRGARMYFYNATTFAAEGSIALGSGPTHAVAVGHGLALVADTRGGALLLVDMATRRIVDRLAAPGGPYGLASDPASGRAWVTITEFNRLDEVAVSHDKMRLVTSTPTVRQPNTVAEDSTTGCTYVAGVATAVLEVSCPGSRGQHS